MEPIIFTYSFTINGYDVTITIEFFPHIVVLEDSSPELTDNEFENIDISLSLWNNQQLKIYHVLFYFTAGLFSAETLYCWVISYNMFFNRADVSAVGIVHGPLLSVPI